MHIDFSKLSLSEVYGLQQETASKIQLRENVIAYQETKQQRKAKVHKALLKDKEQEIVAHDNSRVSLIETIKILVAKFPLEADQEDEYLEAKVF